MTTAEKAYSYNKAVGFLLRFQQEFENRGMPFEVCPKEIGIRFDWQGTRMQLTAMDNGYIMACEKRKIGGYVHWNMTSDRAIWLSRYIAETRKRMNW